MHPPPAGDWCCPRAPEYATLDMQVAIRRHAEEARRLGLGLRVVRDPDLAFDVDLPEDLAELDAPTRA